MISLPDTLEFTTLAGERPTGGLIVKVEIGTRRKNVFHIWSKPSGSDGHVSLRKDDIMQQANRDRQFSPMDYGHPEADFDGTLTATIVIPEIIERALSVYDTFEGAYPFPAGYHEMLMAARERLRQIGNVRLRPTIAGQHPPGSGTVICQDALNAPYTAPS